MDRTTEYVLGARSTLWHEMQRERRIAAAKAFLLYASLALNGYLAFALARCRMGF